MSWERSGSCRSVGDPGLWSSGHPDDHRQAALVCNGCPVKVDCLAFAMAWRHPGASVRAAVGVWGGWLFSFEHGHRIPPRPVGSSGLTARQRVEVGL